MEISGFLMMGTAWAAIISLCIWCFYKLFSEQKSGVTPKKKGKKSRK